MDRVKIACKMALIGIEIKKLMQSTELIADYLQDDEFDEVTLSAIEDTLNMVEKSTQDTCYRCLVNRSCGESENGKGGESQ